ncbi:MAG TPA: hypothetical protein GX398_07595 [Candidatus Cloacimonetes bacterium]|nr:hypothetical protein [Candidatus Cloacimonadota bacterium]
MDRIVDSIAFAKHGTRAWTDFFHSASGFYHEQINELPKYDDEDFSSVCTIGRLEFEDQYDDDFKTKCGIYLIKVDRALTERSSRKKQFDKATTIIRQEYTQGGIFVFYDDAYSFRLSLVYPVYKGTKRTFSNYRRHSFYVSEGLANKTYRLQLSKHEMSSMDELKDIFSVDKVSAIFYKEFEDEYAKLQQGIFSTHDQEVSEELASNFALLFAIRIIFLGFVQKKGWLGDDQSFISNYLQCYDPDDHKQGIYQDLLAPLFFKALNDSPLSKNKHRYQNIPDPFDTHLGRAPYLNGGLFRKHEDYDTKGLAISDDAIRKFVDFLFSYNFTLEENTLYDEELELNPEFLGIIFEKLVNKEYGAIYTPRLEVDFMCRLALIKYLQNNLPDISLENLYKLFFPEYGDESDQTVGDFTRAEAEELLQKLETVTVCDPAIGSGAFAVGMLNVIDEMECSIYANFLPDTPIDTPYERKKRIIFKSLYGVEVQQWAVWITQLRLWITLLIEAEDSFKYSDEPLLPSFDFKIKQGDSLIQMLGDSLFPISGKGAISAKMSPRIQKLVRLKNDYYYNKCPQQLHEIQREHRNIFIGILDDEKQRLNTQIFKRESDSSKIEVQDNIFGVEIQSEIELTSQKFKLKTEELRLKVKEIEQNMQKIAKGDLPFFWSIDFPEIFMYKGGFDIVIGNPPYIAQEEIEDPLGKIKPNTKYKQLLRQMASQDFPQDLSENIISGKSDLYTFFYIRGLRLLNPKGVLNYICSNSWLDVEFGAWLQKFLLERCQIYFIIDNLSKRVFREAGINTIISVIGAPQKRVRDDDLIRFVAFKLPFENSLYTENFLDIEDKSERIDYDDLRMNPVSRAALSEEGWENSEGNKYRGSKWGGVYLKAPDIFFTIMEKGNDKLVKLSDVTSVKRGITTGADDFFYVPLDNPDNIEQDFLKPVIKSPRECKSILIDPDELELYVFSCPYDKNELKSTNALKYIEKGESTPKLMKQGGKKGQYVTGIHNAPSLRNRKIWYDLGVRDIPDLIIPCSFSDSFKVYLNRGVLANKRLYEIHCQEEDLLSLALILNSSLFFFLLEVYSSTSLGEGLLDKMVYEVELTPILDPKHISHLSDIEARIDAIKHREIKSIFEELRVDPETSDFRDANPLPDRKAIDDVVFQALGLTAEEVKALYAGLLELTANRLRKARTFKK